MGLREVWKALVFGSHRLRVCTEGPCVVLVSGSLPALSYKGPGISGWANRAAIQLGPACAALHTMLGFVRAAHQARWGGNVTGETIFSTFQDLWGTILSPFGGRAFQSEKVTLTCEAGTGGHGVTLVWPSTGFPNLPGSG